MQAAFAFLLPGISGMSSSARIRRKRQIKEIRKTNMLSLNDYLYDGNTVVKILHIYSQDLKKEAIKNDNGIDLAHSNCLLQMIELLEHNDFLTSQSQQIREFYKYMADHYPFLAFTFKGRIKSLIRLEEKINGNIVEFIYDHYKKYGEYPDETQVKNQISRIKDLIAYRIVISLPSCHLKHGDDKRALEMKYLYEIANAVIGHFSAASGIFSLSAPGDVHGCFRYRNRGREPPR